MDIQILKINGEEYALLPLSELNKIITSEPRTQKKWYSLDEVCNEFRIKDSEVEFTIPQAADILGRTAGEMRRLIRTKLLTAHKTGGRYVIKKTDLDKYKKGALT